MKYFLILVSIIMANDASLGTINGRVTVMKSKQIEMIKEIVLIKMKSDHAEVTCQFWLKNNGDRINKEIGFPNYYENPGMASIPVENFITIVNETKIKTTTKAVVTSYGDEDIQFAETKSWHVWNQKFDENETIHITNTYKSGYGRGSWLGEHSTGYVYGTGASWYNKIGSGKITFDFSEVISTHFIVTLTTQDGLSPNINYENVIYNYSNFEPSDKAEFHIEFLIPEHYLPNTEALKETLIKKDAQQLRIMRNEVLARRGYIFKDVVLKTFFESQSWYKPNYDFKFDDIGPAETSVISIIKEIEDAK